MVVIGTGRDPVLNRSLRLKPEAERGSDYMDKIFTIRMWKISGGTVKCINHVHLTDEYERPQDGIARAIASANGMEVGSVREDGVTWSYKMRDFLPRYKIVIGKRTKQGRFKTHAEIGFEIEKEDINNAGEGL